MSHLPAYILFIYGACAVAAYVLATDTARHFTVRTRTDRPAFFGVLSAAGFIALGIFVTLLTLVLPAPEAIGARIIYIGLMLVPAGLAAWFLRTVMTPQLSARVRVEKGLHVGLFICAAFAGLITLIMFGLFLSESVRYGLSGSRLEAPAIWPMVGGTLMITGIAMLIAVPLGLAVSVYLSEYAGRKRRAVIKPMMEVLAGLPTVIFGYFALIIVGPGLQNLAARFGVTIPAESALTAGIVVGIMITPLMSSLTDDILISVSDDLKTSAFALGATPSETFKTIIFPAIAPAIAAAFLLGISRAFGETMVVLMAAGRSTRFSPDPTEPAPALTTGIYNIVTGSADFTGLYASPAFLLGLILLGLTFALNMAAFRYVRRYPKRYI